MCVCVWICLFWHRHSKNGQKSTVLEIWVQFPSRKDSPNCHQLFWSVFLLFSASSQASLIPGHPLPGLSENAAFPACFLGLAKVLLAPEKDSVLCWRESSGQHFTPGTSSDAGGGISGDLRLHHLKVEFWLLNPEYLDIWCPAWLGKKYPAGLLS